MISKDEILDLALLSKLSVNEDELPALTADMAKIIGFADTIAGATDSAEFDGISGMKNVFRPDVPEQSYPSEKILENASGGENGFFPVLTK